MRHIRFSVALASLLAAGTGASAVGQPLVNKLAAEPLADIRPGHYRASDRVDFELVESGDRYLLKFMNQNEIFLLTASRAAAGGRVLKYDNGATALQVNSFGALTLYPEDAPNGLPVERVGDAPRFVPETVTLQQLETAAGNAAKNLGVVIAADWDYLSIDGAARSVGLDALENAEQGIARFNSQRGRGAFARSVETIRLQPNIRPSLVLAGKTLMIGFNQSQAFTGRLSSRAVFQTLNGLIPK